LVAYLAVAIRAATRFAVTADPLAGTAAGTGAGGVGDATALVFGRPDAEAAIPIATLATAAASMAPINMRRMRCSLLEGGADGPTDPAAHPFCRMST
jgi:hypothetical protein